MDTWPPAVQRGGAWVRTFTGKREERNMDERAGVTEAQREERRQARTQQKFKAFIRELAQQRSHDEQDAERYAACVLYRLEERLTAGESVKLESQLPQKVRELIPAPPERPQDGGPVYKYHRDDFVLMVAQDLETSPERAEVIIRDVFLVVRAQITGGEADGVAHHLPPDLRALWCRPV
jgi:uncharacterized protein (DUF2267 family)